MNHYESVIDQRINSKKLHWPYLPLRRPPSRDWISSSWEISIWNIKILQSQYEKHLNRGIYQNLGISIWNNTILEPQYETLKCWNINIVDWNLGISWKTFKSWNLKKDIEMLEYQYERFKIFTSIMPISMWDFIWSEPPQLGQRCEIV